MYDRERYKKKYSESMASYCYIIKIDGKDIYKVGKTSRLKYRLINLNQALYDNWDIYRLISCEDNHSALATERHLISQLKDFRLNGKREWFSVEKAKMDEILSAL
jgi:hypothetical protein